MSRIFNPATGIAVGDPDVAPLDPDTLPAATDIAAAASTLILSASGWRKVFSRDGDEESDEAEVSPSDIVLAAAAAMAFAGLLRSRGSASPPTVLVGMDTRPTGPALGDAMIRAFMGLGVAPRCLFMVAAPEIMAYARSEAGIDGFAYISASHNPRGHNGLKFGLRDGGVLGAADSARLIEDYRAILADARLPARVLALFESVEARDLARVFSGCQGWKRRSISAYTLFAREVVSGTGDAAEQELLFDEMARTAALRPIGVVAELNGSARSLSIDRDFLEGLGVRARAVNDRPGVFAHRIVPEGASLADAMRELESAASEDPAFRAAYVPDCDGDRGNLVVLGRDGRARPVEAQEVFALCCVAELAQLVRDGRLGYDEAGNAREKVAVVVNDATSMRVNAIARAFDVDVYRAETGEANVVGLAASLRETGHVVRILGEGSNGGNITFPSAVRDPLSTLGALLKLLLLRGGEGEREGLFEIWLRRSAAAARPPAADFGIDDILSSLPRYATTSVFEPRAALKVRRPDHAELKARYARVFAREWEARKGELAKRFGVASWAAYATRGQAETRVGSDFAASGRGGLRIALLGPSGAPRAFLWMRGSGTEPVFRVMADVEDGGASDEEFLLEWHTRMLREADGP